jgi:putative membrane protein
MNVLAWVLALFAAAVHILVWAWEALLIGRPAVHQGVFGVPTEDVPAIRLWAFGVGFYNLFLGTGMVVGVGLWAAGSVVAGRTLVVYIGLFMVLSGVVLLIADRMGMGRERGKGVGGAIAESVPPLLALVVVALS